MINILKDRLKNKKFKKLYLEHLEKYKNLESEKSSCENDLKKEQIDNLMLDLTDTFEILRSAMESTVSSIEDIYKFDKLPSAGGIIYDCMYGGGELLKLIKDNFENVDVLFKKNKLPEYLENIIYETKYKKINKSNLKKYLKKALNKRQKSRDDSIKEYICKDFDFINYKDLTKYSFLLWNLIHNNKINFMSKPIYLESRVMYHIGELLSSEDLKFIKELLHKNKIDLILI